MFFSGIESLAIFKSGFSPGLNRVDAILSRKGVLAAQFKTFRFYPNVSMLETQSFALLYIGIFFGC